MELTSSDVERTQRGLGNVSHCPSYVTVSMTASHMTRQTRPFVQRRVGNYTGVETSAFVSVLLARSWYTCVFVNLSLLSGTNHLAFLCMAKLTFLFYIYIFCIRRAYFH